MNIDINYVKGVIDTTIDFYEEANGSIDKDKEIEIFYENILDSKTKTIIIGVKVTFVWVVELSRGMHDQFKEDKPILIHSKDKLDAVISDVSSILSDIDEQLIIK